MRNIYLALFLMVFGQAVLGQAYQEDFEAYTIGATGTSVGFTDLSNGSSAIAAGANGNNTQVLLATNTVGGDQFLRSPLFAVTENETYTVTFDFSVTNAVFLVRIRTVDGAGTNALLPLTDVVLTTNNGSISGTNASRIEAITPNTFGQATATFTVPAGHTDAQVQFYQFGLHSFMLDNITAEVAAPPGLYQEDFESYAVGTNGTAAGYTDITNGSSQVTAGALGNDSQELTSSNSNGGDHFLRSPLFSVTEGERYTVSMDIAVTNTVYSLRIRTEDGAGNNTVMPITDVTITTDNGNVSTANGSRIEAVTSDTFGRLTATFTVPAGATSAQFQLYQFGVNSMVIDDVILEVAASPFDYEEDFETYALGTAGNAIGYTDITNGSSEVATGSNGSQVLLSSNTVGGDHFLRSPLFDVEAEQTYLLKFNMAATNSVLVIRMRSEDAVGNNSVLPLTDVLLTTTNGSISTSNASRIEGITPNTFGEVTATFTVPAGAVKGQFQIYQFGVNSMQLDDVTVEAIEIPELYNEDFESYALGSPGTNTGFTDIENGSSEVVAGTNGSQVLLSSNTVGGNHFLRSPFFLADEGETFEISFDISVTNTVYSVRIRTQDDNGNIVILPVPDVILSTDNGAPSAANASRIEGAVSNVFGRTTATFTMPTGATRAQLQLYQFGVNSMTLDNLILAPGELPSNWRAEAESGILAGTAEVQTGCTNASGSAFVKLDTAATNSLTFTDVLAPESGSYELNINYFYNDGESYLDVFVNGKLANEVTFDAAPWCFEGFATTKTIVVPLNAGNNLVTFAPSNERPTPLIDRLELAETRISTWFAEAEAGQRAGNAVVNSGCTNASEQAFVSLFKGTGNTLTFGDVQVTKAGFYKLGFAYFGTDPSQSLAVTVNGTGYSASDIEAGTLCVDAGAKYGTVLVELQAGSNSITLAPAGNDLKSPQIDWLDINPFEPAFASLNLTKERVRPGETIEVPVSTAGVPVTATSEFAVEVIGLSAADYVLSNPVIRLAAGDTEASVTFTPSASLGETDIQLNITALTSDVLVTQSSANASITSIAQTIYISTTDGDDAHDGFSEQSPLKTLARASELGQITGDQVRLKAGDTFFGQLEITGSGTATEPLVVTSYGEGEKPLLNGSVASDSLGSFEETIRIVNRSHITIANLAITNPRTTSRAGISDSNSYGILVLNEADSVLSGFKFQDLHISEIFSISNIDEVPFNQILVTGIFVEVTNSNPGSVKYVEDIIVEDSYFTTVGKIGFWARRRFNNQEETQVRDSVKNREIIFRNNTVFENGGSGIVLSNALNALIESNTFDKTGSDLVPDKMAGRGSGAWFFQCTNVVAQHNISRSVRGDNDSYGMHIDYGNKDVLFQYNYSEDSEGGFVEILGDNINSIWRYNISVNDGLRDRKGNTLWISDFAGFRNVKSTGNFIYNNSVFVGNGFTPDIEIKANDAHIYNNIFQSLDGSQIGAELLLEIDSTALDVSNNLFDGDVSADFIALDNSAVLGDPKYVEPGKLEPDGYRLLRKSPALKSGEERVDPDFPAAGQGIFSHISAVPETDYFGNPLTNDEGESVIPIGAYSGKGLKIKRLWVFGACDQDTTGVNKWMVFNPNSFAVSVDWEAKNLNFKRWRRGNSQPTASGSLVAQPGKNFFYTEDDDNPRKKEMMIISWNDVRGRTNRMRAIERHCGGNPFVFASEPNVSEKNAVDGLKSVYPNPITRNGMLNLMVSARHAGQVQLRITNAQGEVVLSQAHQVVEGENLVQLSLSQLNLESHLATVQVIIDGVPYSRKFLLRQ